MTSPDRVIIDPRGAIEPQFERPPVAVFRMLTWFVLGACVLGDLALSFGATTTPVHLQFGVATVLSYLALAVQYTRR